MSMTDKIRVEGKVIRDPVERQTSKGPVVAFTLAVSKGEKTRYLECSAWKEEVAKEVLASVHHLDNVMACGTFRQNSWVGRDGVTRISDQLTVDRVYSAIVREAAHHGDGRHTEDGDGVSLQRHTDTYSDATSDGITIRDIPIKDEASSGWDDEDF